MNIAVFLKNIIPQQYDIEHISMNLIDKCKMFQLAENRFLTNQTDITWSIKMISTLHISDWYGNVYVDLCS